MVTRAFPDDEPDHDELCGCAEKLEAERPACATMRRARTAEDQIADEAADRYERDYWARGEQ